MNANLALAIVTLALVVGPLLERFGRRTPALAAVVDGATVGGILVVSLLHLLPEAGDHLGWWSLALLLAGLVLPHASERYLTRRWEGWRVTIGLLALLVLAVHLLIEGAALASTAHEERIGLALVLVVAGHNLPIGLLLWGQARRRFSVAWSLLLILGLGSLAWFGPLLMASGRGTFQAVCSALLAGGLLHLVLEHGLPAPGWRRTRALDAWSGVAAVGTAVGLATYLARAPHVHAHVHEHVHGQIGARFVELLLETAPPLLLGVAGAALIEAFLPGRAFRWLSRGGQAQRALRGVALGAPMPVCSCGVLPIYRSLVQRGVAPTAALALLIAAPEIGLDSILLSWPLLGSHATVARVVAALLLALGVGWIVGRLAGEPAPVRDAPRDEADRRGWRDVRRGLLETWGHLSPWILVGLLATVLVEPWLSTDWAAATPAWLQVLGLSLAGMPTYICATAATPFAALLLAKGFAPGAVIAFLLTGPATNVTTFGALRGLHGTRVALSFVGTSLGLAVALGMAIDVLFPGGLGSGSWARAAEGHGHGLLHRACAAVLGILTLWVVCEHGPRAFLAQLLPEGGHSHPGHPEGEEHAHADHEHGRGHARPGSYPPVP